jgi:hypothetical protein
MEARVWFMIKRLRFWWLEHESICLSMYHGVDEQDQELELWM